MDISVTGAACLEAEALSCLARACRCALPAGDTAPGSLPEALPPEVAEAAGALPLASRGQGGPIRHFRASRLVAGTVAAALADAGLTCEGLAGSGTGFVSGSTYGTAEFLDSLRLALDTRGPRAVRPTDFAIATQGYPMSALTMTYQTIGPATAFVCGQSATGQALDFAELMMQVGQAARMVVVGYEILGPQTRRHAARLGQEAPAETVVALVLEHGPGLVPLAGFRAACTVSPAGKTPPARLGAARLHHAFRTLFARVSGKPEVAA
ncbi:MAG: beta-ketoacyl synthase N-terminal-like domain-containing protein [Tropicimonas sp.]|uniref:beta-ketoacyl synthase N-terminal-like domain-containing protein n=1 Tax=Tropicimonas sp. TaxID=2067044 RepID=UPI003A86BE4E